MIRAPVLVMTVCATVVGILLATGVGVFHLDRALALLTGLIMAHATNNLLNDWIDSRRGVDRDNYFRTRYGVQVIESGLVQPVPFMIIVVLTALPALLAGAYLVALSGVIAFYLMLAGAFFVVFYTWPLKYLALGEVAVLLVWGPLMIAGSYYVMVGDVSGAVWLISLVMGIPPTLVILGKHLDKYAEDQKKGVLTLPVATGEQPARQISIALIIVQWILIGVLLWFFPEFLPVGLCLIATPAAIRLVGQLSRPRPGEKPAAFPANIWPLWFSAGTFLYARNFGIWMVIAMILVTVIHSGTTPHEL